MSGMSLKFRPSGPVGAAFMADRKQFAGIMGPIGSAKTSTSVMRAVQIGQEQAPSPIDGIRYTKGVVIRDTYRQLWKTTIPSWNAWLPQTFGHWHGGEGQPAKHHLRFADRDGILVDIVVLFAALGDQKVEDFCKGFEVTWFWLNEMDLCNPEVFRWMPGRAGRYPSKKYGGPTWYGGWGDFNAPDEDNYVVEQLIYNRPEEYSFYKQPSGFSPKAENLENLPEGYYQKAAIGQKKWWIRRNIENRLGYSRDGQPVYEDYNDDIHVFSEKIKPVRGLPLSIGVDAGRTPAAIFGQKMADGQVRVCGELVAKNCGAKTFGRKVLAFIEQEYPEFHISEYRGWGDPAADYASDHDDEETWLDILSAVTGIKFKAAPGNNNLTMRLAAVEEPLTRLVDGQPGIVISPSCPIIRKGFNSGYKFKKTVIAGTEKTADKPDKNEYSHPHDALQYLCLGLGEGKEALNRGNLLANRPQMTFQAKTGFNVFGGAA